MLIEKQITDQLVNKSVNFVINILTDQRVSAHHFALLKQKIFSGAHNDFPWLPVQWLQRSYATFLTFSGANAVI